MSKFWRALLVSAAATAAAAVVMKLVEPDAPPVDASPTTDGPYVDADAMTREEQDLLMQELGAQL